MTRLKNAAHAAMFRVEKRQLLAHFDLIQASMIQILTVQRKNKFTLMMLI